VRRELRALPPTSLRAAALAVHDAMTLMRVRRQ
jgi:hypothetical protein